MTKIYHHIKNQTVSLAAEYMRHFSSQRHTDLSLKLFSKGIQVQIFETFWIFQDLLQSSGWVGVFCRLIILEGVNSHLASPLVSLRVDTRPIQNLNVGVGTVWRF